MLVISQICKPLSEAVIFKLEPPEVLVKNHTAGPHLQRLRFSASGASLRMRIAVCFQVMLKQLIRRRDLLGRRASYLLSCCFGQFNLSPGGPRLFFSVGCLCQRHLHLSIRASG